MLPEIAIPSPSARTQAARAGVLTLVLLSCGHFFADMYSGALGALQPLLVNRFGLTLAQAGMLGGFLVFSSSVMQPVYGFLSDRFHTRLFAALGPAVAGIFVFCALVFGTLTVRDEGDHLVLRFGPVPVFGTLIRYADLTAVEPGRTSLIDGWGIHYIPWRGWTYNLWGFGCVKLTLGKRVIRVGSDDVENLAAFLKAKIQPPG